MAEDLIERAEVLARALEVADRREGPHRLVVIPAGPGLGKTSVLDWLADAVRTREIRRAVAAPSETGLPFAVLAQALPEIDHARAVAATSPEARSALFYDVVDAVYTAGPLTLLLDDLHWADPDSLTLLAFLVRRLDESCLSVIAAMRPDPAAAREQLTDLVSGGAGEVIELVPLTRAGSRLLVERATTEGAARDADQCHDLSGGNPMLLELLLAGPEPASGSGAAGDIVRARFARLQPDLREYLECAAVLGMRFRPELAGQLAGRASDDVDRVLRRLVALGLLRHGGSGFVEFVHPLYQQALANGLEPVMTDRLHARAFGMILDRELPDAEAAPHALQAAASGDSRAVALLERVARDAQSQGAVQVAAGHFATVVALLGERASSAQLLASARAEATLGRATEVVDLAHRILNHPDARPEERVSAMRLLGVAAAEVGDVSGATGWLERAAHLVERDHPELAAEILLDLAGLAAIAPVPEATAAAERARELATSPGLAARATAVHGLLRLLSGDAGLVEDALSGLDWIDPRTDASWSWSSGLRGLGQIAYLVERYDEADEAFGALVDWADDNDAVLTASAARFAWIDAAQRQGRIEGIREALRSMSQAAPLSPSLEVLHVLAAAVGEYDYLPHDEATQRLRDARASLSTGAPWIWHGWLDVLAGRDATRAADIDLASEHYLRAEEIARNAGLMEPCAITWARGAIDAHLRVGRRADALRALAFLREGSARVPCIWPQIGIRMGTALIAEADGDDDTASTMFAEALSLHERVSLPPQRITDAIAYGSFLRRQRRLSEARVVLVDALNSANRIGAVGLAEDASKELRAAGGRRRRVDAVTGLTPQEARVAELARAGHSNREIAGALSLSVKTVESHLGRVYTKLGVHGRADLKSPSNVT